jgi:hypothetical protein
MIPTSQKGRRNKAPLLLEHDTKKLSNPDFLEQAHEKMAL